MKLTSSPYEQVLDVLTAHVATINARSMLDRAMSRAGLRSAEFQMAHLGAILPALDHGLRLFVDAESYLTLRRRLDELSNNSGVDVEAQRIPIKEEQDISRARNSARALSQLMGARSLVVQRVATIVSELARNIVSYTPGGEVELRPLTTGTRRLLVCATDIGSGIDDVELVLSGRYQSKTGMGLGLVGTRRLADRFDIQTGTQGTRIEAEVHI